jgi:hypothetical protein
MDKALTQFGRQDKPDAHPKDPNPADASIYGGAIVMAPAQHPTMFATIQRCAFYASL